jgi:hypothetical protein
VNTFNLKQVFATQNSAGLIGVAEFDQLVGEAREQRMQQAFLQVQKLLELLDGE